MITYYLIFGILSLLAYQEIYNSKLFNIYYFIFLTLLFSFFIGLRNEIGCDWEGYKRIFDLSNCVSDKGSNQCIGFNIFETIDYLKFKEIGLSSINLIIRRIGGNFYLLNLVFAFFFILPLLKFCSTLKRPFLAILISYPYLITVIGLGTIRQSISIAFLMVGINQLKHLKFYKYYFYNIIAILFHYTSCIFLFLPFIIDTGRRDLSKKFKDNFYILIFIFTFLVFLYTNNYFALALKNYFYLFSVESISLKSPLFIWIMIFVPSAIILLNYKYYEDEDINKFWRNYSIIGILMFCTLFVNNIISLRFLLYFLPIKIYALSNLPNVRLFNMSLKYSYLIIIFLSFSMLTVWLNFANHSYCYVPYKNLLLK